MSSKQTLSSTINIITTVDCSPDNTFIYSHKFEDIESVHLPSSCVSVLWELEVLLEIQVSACNDYPYFCFRNNLMFENDDVHNISMLVNNFKISDRPTPLCIYESDFYFMYGGGLFSRVAVLPHNLHKNHPSNPFHQNPNPFPISTPRGL